MKLCFICAEYPPGPHGGIGTRYQTLGRALVEAGHEVRVIGAYRTSYPAPDFEVDEGVQVWRLRERGGKFGWVPAWYRLYRRVRQWVSDGAVDLVEAPDSRGWLAGWPALPVPVILRATGSNTYLAHLWGKRINLLTHCIERLSYARSDAWISETHYLGEAVRHLFGVNGPDIILPNIVYPPASVPPFKERDPHQVLFAGTLHENKGIVSLLDAWPEVLRRVPDAVLYVYGKDTRHPRNSSMQKYLMGRMSPSTRKHVRFMGHVDRSTLFEALMRARVSIFPSFAESFGMMAIESMACACPTIYTTRSCGPEMVRHGLDGWLVDPAKPRELAQALVGLLRDDVLSRRLGENGRARVLDSYTAEHILPKTLGFYNDVMHRFHARPGQVLLSVCTERSLRIGQG